MSSNKYKKGEPTIEKIKLSEAQKEDIKQIMSGGLSKESVKSLENRGINIENYVKSRRPESTANRIRIVRNKYFQGGLCHVCQAFPDYKVTFQLDGIELLELYCEKHLEYAKK